MKELKGAQSGHCVSAGRKMGPESFEEKLIKAIRTEGCSIIVLAGFLSILFPHFISEFRDRILNITLP